MFPFASYVSCGQSKPRLIFSCINGPIVSHCAAIPQPQHPQSTIGGKGPRNWSFSSCQESPTFDSRNQPTNFSNFSCQGGWQHERSNLSGKRPRFINNAQSETPASCLKCEEHFVTIRQLRGEISQLKKQGIWMYNYLRLYIRVITLFQKATTYEWIFDFINF